jgi:N-acetylmuramoyl-L-alanine amidase
MKTIHFLFAIMLTLLLFQISATYGYDRVCIDPGHGGPGASKYYCNGGGYNNYRGAFGPIDSLTEQWVNLQVGLKLEYWVDVFAWPLNAIMTRYDDSTNMSLEMRADRANKRNGGAGVNEFISVHHNGLPLNHQGTETWWCTAAKTDSGWDRDTTDLLAKKVRWRIRDMWHYCSRCEIDPDNCDPIVNMDCEDCIDKKVLRLVKMASVLSEASNLNNAHEESLFNDPSFAHIDSEVVAMFQGWYSFFWRSGVVTITYAYEGGYSGQVIIDYEDTITTPFVTCWGHYEEHVLTCKGTMNVAGHTYTFNHWNHEWGEVPHDPNNCWHETDYDTTWYISVPSEHDHNYYAYMTGGPFSVTVISPNGWEIWHVGEQRYIHWSATPGADSSNKVDIHLSRDGGSNWTPIADDLPYDFGNGGYYLWTVTGAVSTECRIKITAHDCAQNNGLDISNYDFSISETGNNNPEIDTGLHCKYAQEECNDCIKWGESFTLEVHAHDPDADSIYYEWSVTGGSFPGHFSNGESTMTTAQNWVVYIAPTKGKDQEKDRWSVLLTAKVVDVRGGSKDTSGYLKIYDAPTNCICGDLYDDSIIDGSDLVFLLDYLFFAGAPPPDPLETGDMNNDCVVDGGDLVYLMNYLFVDGSPPPKCCWIHY